MHEHNCYFSEPLQNTVLREIIDYVTRGTELAHGITRQQHKELQSRVELRMEFYTKHFSRMRFLDSKTDETPKQRDLFRDTFNNLVENWSENVYAVPDSPDGGDIRPKKRKKKGKRAKLQFPSSPVLFPNLVREDSDVPWSTAASNTDSPRDTTPKQDTASQKFKMQLASIAASALRVANREEEEGEEREEEGEEGEEGEDKDEDDRAYAANIQDLVVGFTVAILPHEIAS
jgi:hypothetical protein